MTFFYPDLDDYVDVTLEANTLVVCARATLSRSVADRFYAKYKADAARVGATFIGYHWLNYGTEVEQAKFCFSHVGPDVPLMIDAEDVAGNTGYVRPNTVNNINAFADDYRALGGKVNLAYVPRWYWENKMGSPDLTPLQSNGLHLVNSYYTTYRDDGPGWAPYGGVTPLVWQYADAHSYGGGLVDHNAVKVPYDEFRQLLLPGGTMDWNDPITANGVTFPAKDWITGISLAIWDAAKAPSSTPAQTLAAVHALTDAIKATNDILEREFRDLGAALANIGTAGERPPVDAATLAEAIRTVLGSLAVPPAAVPAGPNA